MHKEKDFPENEVNIKSLREMQESLLVLQNSYNAITIIIEKILTSQNTLEQHILELLQIEVELTSNEIEKLNKLIRYRIALVEKTS